MQKIYKRILSGFAACLFIIGSSFTSVMSAFPLELSEGLVYEESVETAPIIPTQTPKPSPSSKPTSEATTTPISTPEPTPISEPVQTDISIEDIHLMALITMAEAGNQCELGQRLVIDTILNRKDSTHFPDTIQGVIYQKNQFSCVWNGMLEHCYVKDEIVQLVYEELASRTNYDVIFFRTRYYIKYGSPLFKVGDHYFSSYS